MDSLTSLRFFAALHVVLYHAGTRLFIGAPPWLENIRAHGYVAVSFFFVLSGFILTYNYVEIGETRRFDFRRFFLARFSRIYPVYLLALLVLAGLSGYLFGPAFFFNQIGSGLANVFLAQSWVPPYALSWNFPGWSISTEVFFYAVFPLLTPHLRREIPGRVLLLLLTLCFVLMLTTSSFYVLAEPDEGVVTVGCPDGFWAAVLDFNPMVRLPEFLMGVGVARLFLGERRAGSAPTGTLAAVAGATGSLLLLLQRGLPEPLMHALPVPFFALIVLGCARGVPGVDRLLSLSWLVGLGDASYSLYILQLPVGIALLTALGRPPAFLSMSAGLFLAYLAVLVVASVLTFRLLERPVQRWLRRPRSAPGATPKP